MGCRTQLRRAHSLLTLQSCFQVLRPWAPLNVPPAGEEPPQIHGSPCPGFHKHVQQAGGRWRSWTWSLLPRAISVRAAATAEGKPLTGVKFNTRSWLEHAGSYGGAGVPPTQPPSGQPLRSHWRCGGRRGEGRAWARRKRWLAVQGVGSESRKIHLNPNSSHASSVPGAALYVQAATS